jgi:life-span regulatory factor Ecl1
MTLLQSSADFLHSHHSSQSNSKHHSQHGRSSKRPVPVRPAFRRCTSGHKHKRVSIDDSPHVDIAYESDDDMASFPQFCTVCEKQIANPCSSILYCSERCRKKDTNKPLADTSISTSPLSHHKTSRPVTPTQSSHDEFHSPRDIIPRRSPTLLTSNRFSYTSLSSVASGFSDAEPFDPTVDQASETSTSAPTSQHWRSPVPSSRHAHRRQDSEAARYLRQFQSASFIAEVSTRPSRRPKAQSRASTASIITMPSLSTGSTNSIDGSPPGSDSGSMTPPKNMMAQFASLPYMNLRPLPPRTNPAYSSSYHGPKSISLVTPGIRTDSDADDGHHGSEGSGSVDNPKLPGFKARPSISMDVGAELLPTIKPDDGESEEMRYEKRSMVGSVGSDGPGTLRSLFRFSDMQAPPT